MIDIIQNYWLLLLIGQFPNGPLGGLAMTLILAICGICLAFPCSIGIALALTSPYKSLRTTAQAFVYIVRGLPLLMFIFWAYFAIPALLGTSVPGVITMLFALVIYESVYLAEVIRGGIQALPSGQVEAARSMGLTHMQTQRIVILPQVLYNVLPSILSQFISTIKETSLGYVISVNELTFAANQVNSILLTRPFDVYLLLAVIYFTLCFILTSCVRLLEFRVERGRKSLRVNNQCLQKTS
jgi:polar amino acid transport system permease protein